MLAYGVAVRAAEMQGYPFNNIHESLCPVFCKDRFKNLSQASYGNSVLDRRQVTQEIKPRACLRESFRFRHGKRAKIVHLCPETNAMKINVPLDLHRKNRSMRTDDREHPVLKDLQLDEEEKEFEEFREVKLQKSDSYFSRTQT